MFKNFFKKGLYATAGLGAAGYGASYYFFPDVRKSHTQVFQAGQRVARVSTAAARMAYIYSSDPDGDWHDKHVKASKVLFDAMLKNGGIYIKLGQMIATIDVLAPNEYIDQFQLLYQEAKQSSFSDVRQQIEQETGKTIEELFSKFDDKPISTASIAQVHKATLKETGEEVAVKVQHCWLKEQTSGDINIVYKLIDIGEKFFPEFKYKWFGEELEKNLPKELDFVQEADNCEKTGEYFKNSNEVIVPKIYRNISTDKLLVMEWIDGVPINKVKDIKEMGHSLKDVCRILTHTFSQQIFKYGFVHSDPHPGNLFVCTRTDKKGKKYPVVCLLDHGLYQYLPEQTRIDYSYLWKGILTKNEEMIKTAATNLGVAEFYPLLAAMISRKTFADIMDNDEEDFNKRLYVANTQEEKTRLSNYAQEFAKEITIVLHRINRDVILLFKTNDFLSTITNQLGSPVKKFEITAKYCFDAIEEKEVKEDSSFNKRVNLWFQKKATMMALGIVDFYMNLLAFLGLRKQAPEPDDLVFDNM